MATGRQNLQTDGYSPGLCSMMPQLLKDLAQHVSNSIIESLRTECFPIAPKGQSTWEGAGNFTDIRHSGKTVVPNTVYSM